MNDPCNRTRIKTSRPSSLSLLTNYVMTLGFAKKQTMSPRKSHIWDTKKSCVRQTQNPSMRADSGTNTKTNRNGQKRGKNDMKKFHVSHVTCLVSCVICCVSRVTCHLSLTPTATATDPPPASYPIMHSRLFHKKKTIIVMTSNQKFLEVCQQQEYAIQPEVSSALGAVFPRWHRPTHRGLKDISTELAHRIDSVKKYYIFFF